MSSVTVNYHRLDKHRPVQWHKQRWMKHRRLLPLLKIKWRQGRHLTVLTLLKHVWTMSTTALLEQWIMKTSTHHRDHTNVTNCFYLAYIIILLLISLFLETKEDFPAILLPITRGQSRYSGFIPGGALMSSVLLSAIGTKLFITGSMHESFLRLSFQMFSI